MNSIDWVFAAVILIGGRYFGSKYFKLSKQESLNFLGFATAFGIAYLTIIYFTKGISKNDVANLFITYLLVTSFYELIAERLFEFVEGKFGKKKTATVAEAVQKYEVATGEKVEDKENIPVTPPKTD